MTENNLSYLPFNAINEFMLDDYRHEILTDVFSSFSSLSVRRKKAIEKIFVNLVKIPGFRNSFLAPVSLKVKNSSLIFAKKSDFTAQVLMAWSELHSDLARQVYDLLVERNWQLLPLDTDRTILPGFLTDWPKENTYEQLNEAFNQKYPNHSITDNDVRLMVVWLSGRLPANQYADDTENEVME